MLIYKNKLLLFLTKKIQYVWVPLLNLILKKLMFIHYYHCLKNTDDQWENKKIGSPLIFHSKFKGRYIRITMRNKKNNTRPGMR